MLFRFSLYGFLKNQRYFEPFLLLFFLENGLNYTQIGILVGIREILLYFFEIPSGAVADTMGRKRSMVFSFSAYIISFATFSLVSNFYLFIPAMVAYGLGDAFRTGTHKAMIFTWLREQGKISEKTKYYGITRSWSKFGSAFSLIIAGSILYFFNSYRFLFIATIIPYIFGIINFYFYPGYLDQRMTGNQRSLKSIWTVLFNTIKKVLKEARLKRLMMESISFGGGFKASKDYLQPILKSLALTTPLFFLAGSEGKEREAIIISLVYILLYLFSAFASRFANRLSIISGGDYRASVNIWKANLIVYSALIPILYFQYYIIAVFLFIAINILQNLWRPILISRFEIFTTESTGATLLSIESQAKSVGTIILAPLLGFAVDLSKANLISGEFWPLGVVGVLLAIPFITKIKNRDD